MERPIAGDGLITQENERSEYQRIVHEESVRMARIVDDLKDLAQIEEGQMAMNLTPLDLRTPIDQAAATVRPVAGDKGIDLSVNLPLAMSALIADGGRLQQVVFNLLDSSLRHTPRDHLPLVFQRFHQGHGQGRGLGLAIVRSFVQARGGEVGVTSAIGTGTTFRFRVPVAPLTA